MSKEQFAELINKFDILIKLTAANIFQGKPMTESIVFLSDLGLQPKDIAKILGTTSNYVSMIKSRSKKRKKKRKTRSKSRAIVDKGGEKTAES